MSYANMLLYGASLPSYSSRKDGKGSLEQEVIDAGDPANKDKVAKFFAEVD